MVEIVPLSDSGGLPRRLPRDQALCVDHRPSKVHSPRLLCTGPEWLPQPCLPVVQREEELLSPPDCQEDQSHHILLQDGHA